MVQMQVLGWRVLREGKFLRGLHQISYACGGECLCGLCCLFFNSSNSSHPRGVRRGMDSDGDQVTLLTSRTSPALTVPRRASRRLRQLYEAWETRLLTEQARLPLLSVISFKYVAASRIPAIDRLDRIDRNEKVYMHAFPVTGQCQH